MWPTTGENIRYGSREYSENDMKAIVGILFPIGTIYCGENSFILSTGTWETIGGGRLIAAGDTTISGTLGTRQLGKDSDINVVYLRIWKRIS